MAWDGDHYETIPGISSIRDEGDFIRLTGVQPGSYDMDVAYRGATHAPEEIAWNYPIKPPKTDTTTHGNWGGKYGRDGFILCNYDEAESKTTDRRQHKARRVAVEMFDGKTLERIAPVQMVRDFTGGKYLIYRCDNSVRFRIDQVRGDNATLSGIFFDPIH